MRRLLSILLFGLLLYNMMGYAVVYLLEERYEVSAGSGDFIERSLYSDDIVIKIPVAVPYQTSWDNAEPAEGKIRHAGEYYQMKTRQLINDTLYVHCESDQNARDRFMMLVSHIQEEIAGINTGGHKKSPSALLKSLLKDYMSCQRKHVFYLMEWSAQLTPAYDQYQFIALNTYLSIPSPPPDPVCISVFFC